MDIASRIDHTNLNPDATEESIRQNCQEVLDYGFRGIDINPYWVSFCKNILKGTGFKVITVIDWPNGAAPTESRIAQAKIAKGDGADEIDPLINVANIKMGRFDVVLDDLRALGKILPTKVILETGYLTDEEIFKASNLVEKSGAYCVKTSTGVPPKVDIDTKAEHIKIMKEGAPSLKIKAAGGIRNQEDAEKLVKAGADIIGTSTSLKVIDVNDKKEE